MVEFKLFYNCFGFRHADPHSGICLWCLTIQQWPIVPFSHFRYVLQRKPSFEQSVQRKSNFALIEIFFFCRMGVSFWWSFRREAYKGIVSCGRGLYWTCQKSCTSGKEFWEELDIWTLDNWTQDIWSSGQLIFCTFDN